MEVADHKEKHKQKTMDDLNLDLDNIEANAEKNLQTKDRFAKLTEKGLEAEKGRQEAEAKLQTEAQARATAEKERDFFKSFSQISSKHPGAAEYQDQILERVNKGYDPEEAALAVLAKEGKLSNQAPVQRQAQAEGGSALTNLGEGGNKAVSEMSQDERMQALLQAEKEGANLLRF